MYNEKIHNIYRAHRDANYIDIKSIESVMRDNIVGLHEKTTMISSGQNKEPGIENQSCVKIRT